MLRDFRAALLVATGLFAPVAQAQDRSAVERAVSGLAAEWNRTWNAHDAGAWAALFDRPVGVFIFGATAYPLDSIKPVAARYMSQRSNEAWTVDKVHVVPLSDTSAFLQFTLSGRYTLASGITWEYDRSAHVTALVHKRGNAWKIVASANSAGGRRLPP